jgi:predicted dehydrogenase
MGEVCHFVDLLTVLADDRVVEVQATALPDAGRYRQDNVVATLRFSRGSVGTVIYAANGHRGLEKERLEVMSAGKSAVLDDFRRLTTFGEDGSRVIKRAPDKGHAAEMAAFVSAVQRGGASPVPLNESVHVTMVTLAMVAALNCGQTVAIDETDSSHG